jgi:signal transduction histidine kinase
MCGDVEGAHGVPVELVVVGDCDVDERVGAVVAATREAVVNAAKHSGAPSVDVYAEVEPGTVSVFVRDRGRGFDPSTVPTDRHGLSGSVVGRMERHGGTASIRSTVGTGTEVRLELPRG